MTSTPTTEPTPDNTPKPLAPIDKRAAIDLVLAKDYKGGISALEPLYKNNPSDVEIAFHLLLAYHRSANPKYKQLAQQIITEFPDSKYARRAAEIKREPPPSGKPKPDTTPLKRRPGQKGNEFFSVVGAPGWKSEGTSGRRFHLEGRYERGMPLFVFEVDRVRVLFQSFDAVQESLRATSSPTEDGTHMGYPSRVIRNSSTSEIRLVDTPIGILSCQFDFEDEAQHTACVEMWDSLRLELPPAKFESLKTSLAFLESLDKKNYKDAWQHLTSNSKAYFGDVEQFAKNWEFRDKYDFDGRLIEKFGEGLEGEGYHLTFETNSATEDNEEWLFLEYDKDAWRVSGYGSFFRAGKPWSIREAVNNPAPWVGKPRPQTSSKRQPAKSKRPKEDGITAILGKDYATGLDLLEPVFEDNPNDVKVAFYLFTGYKAMAPDKAKEMARKIIELEPQGRFAKRASEYLTEAEKPKKAVSQKSFADFEGKKFMIRLFLDGTESGFGIGKIAFNRRVQISGTDVVMKSDLAKTRTKSIKGTWQGDKADFSLTSSEYNFSGQPRGEMALQFTIDASDSNSDRIARGYGHWTLKNKLGVHKGKLTLTVSDMTYLDEYK